MIGYITEIIYGRRLSTRFKHVICIHWRATQRGAFKLLEMPAKHIGSGRRRDEKKMQNKFTLELS